MRRSNSGTNGGGGRSAGESGVVRWGAALLCAVLWPAGGLAAARDAAEALRPVYLIGHGANTLTAARKYLEAGANGLEVDVNTLAGQPNVLCIGHGPDVGIGASARHRSVPLPDYLDGLHALAQSHPEFSLVYFDCKTLTATPELGQQLLEAIRAHLEGSGADRVELNVLVSVGKLRQKAMFANIAHQLGPREGLMVDGYSDPDAVAAFFDAANITNRAFCDGIVPLNPFLGLFEVYGSVRQACRQRDQTRQFQFVGTWVVNNPGMLARYLRMGVDGIVVDRRLAWYNFCWANWGNGLRSLTRLVRHHGAALGIRPANRADNPFARATLQPS